MSVAAYEPGGIRFYDGHSRREMLLVTATGDPHVGWLCRRGPDGGWVTDRPASAADLDRLWQALIGLLGHFPSATG